ncbi:MAG: alcohol dehydrogenase catalytic domain-containing protein [Thermoplasmata archaeon]|nr:alcohol dehydrogenase catalytic domain-containing protein [Thermoplasmata archaeon]
MKVGVLSEGRVQIEERPAPTPGPGELVVTLAACGICGTDLEKLRGNYRTAGILGHEAVGSVDALGEGVEKFHVGDRVFVHHHVPCYACEVCRRGAFTFCPEYAKSNLDPGGFAEKFRVSADHVRKGAVLRLDPKLTWEEGALLEPAACALTALRAVRFDSGDRVMILGLGPVGLLYARVAHALGAGWIGGTELSPLRRDAASRGGVEVVLDPRDPAKVREAVERGTHGAGADLVVVATGAPAAVELAGSLGRRGGTVNLFGLPLAGSRLGMDLQQLYLRGLRVVPTYATTERDVADLHALVARGRLPVADLVSHRTPLAEIEEAFELAARPGVALKVLVTGPAFAGRRDEPAATTLSSAARLSGESL